MILKGGSNINYGIPYMGSKSSIIDKISKYFPDAENFYDLFGGGFSVTHYMLTKRLKSYKNFYFNEIRPGICDLIKDAINGKFNYDNFKPKWISREEFFIKKDTDPYIKIIWSFGNDGKSYLFSKDIEPYKKSLHMAVVFNEFDDLFIKRFGFSKWPNHLDITGKRIYIRNRQKLQQLEQLLQLERLQQLERLERLQQLERIERLEFSSKDYRDVNIKQNSIIYCDIPYKKTQSYDNQFSHEDFYNWASVQKNPVFISEYDIDDTRFFLLKKFKKRCKLSAAKNNLSIEKLYGNNVAFDIIKKHREANS